MCHFCKKAFTVMSYMCNEKTPFSSKFLHSRHFAHMTVSRFHNEGKDETQRRLVQTDLM